MNKHLLWKKLIKLIGDGVVNRGTFEDGHELAGCPYGEEVFVLDEKRIHMKAIGIFTGQEQTIFFDTASVEWIKEMINTIKKGGE